MKLIKFTCFLVRFRRGKETREGETRLSRDRNILETQINNCLGTFGQCSASLKPFQSNVNVVCQVYKQFISRALYVKISEEDIGAKKGD